VHESCTVPHHHRPLHAMPLCRQTLEAMGASSTAVDFVCSALQRQPSQRPSAVELRAHPWLLKHCGGRSLKPCQFAA